MQNASRGDLVTHQQQHLSGSEVKELVRGAQKSGTGVARKKKDRKKKERDQKNSLPAVSGKFGESFTSGNYKYTRPVQKLPQMNCHHAKTSTAVPPFF